MCVCVFVCVVTFYFVMAFLQACGKSIFRFIISLDLTTWCYLIPLIKVIYNCNNAMYYYNVLLKSIIIVVCIWRSCRKHIYILTISWHIRFILVRSYTEKCCQIFKEVSFILVFFQSHFNILDSAKIIKVAIAINLFALNFFSQQTFYFQKNAYAIF